MDQSSSLKNLSVLCMRCVTVNISKGCILYDRLVTFSSETSGISHSQRKDTGLDWTIALFWYGCDDFFLYLIH